MWRPAAWAGGGVPTSPVHGSGADGKPSYVWASSAFYRCLMLDGDALLSCREALRAAVEFGTIMAWFYVADRTQLIAPGTKVRHRLVGAGRRAGGAAGAARTSPAYPFHPHSKPHPAHPTHHRSPPQSYSRDVFLFIFIVLTAVACGYSLKQHRTLLLHRTQTEEWKGWMQARGGAGGTAGRSARPRRSAPRCARAHDLPLRRLPPLPVAAAAAATSAVSGPCCTPAHPPCTRATCLLRCRSSSCSTTTLTPRRSTMPSASSSQPTCG